MSGQVHSGTVFRALFAGGIAVWSKAAAIAKARTVVSPEVEMGTAIAPRPDTRGRRSPAHLPLLSRHRLEAASPVKPPPPRGRAP
jgi:hypothetical protein